MKNPIPRSIAALMLCATAAVAQADDKGFYVGGGIGQVSVDEANFDDEDMTLSLFGGYQFNRYFSVEGGYTDLGEIEPEATGSSLEADAWHATAVGTLQLNDGFSLFAKGGFARWDVNNSLPGLGSEDSGTDPTYGLGAQYRFTDQVSTRFEFSRFELEDVDADVAQLQLRVGF